VTAGAVSVSSSTIRDNTGYAISAAAPAVLSGLTGLSVSGNGPGKDLIERRAGTISVSQTWVTTTIPYALTGVLYVSGSPAPTLTIQPGATVKFSSGADLAISYPLGGVLKASGTSTSPILFTANGSTTPGFWHGVYLGNQRAPASTISYATVEYGGSTAAARGGIHVDGSSPTLDHVTVQFNTVAGFTVNGGSPTITNSPMVTGNSGPGLLVSAGSASVTNSTITNNTGYAISAAPNAVLTGLSGLTVSGNGPGKDLIERQAGTISASQTWVTTTIPYAVTGNVLVSGSPAPTLTIQPGVTMKFSYGAALVINSPSGGVLRASGTSTSPILFTANGSTTPGFWQGVYLGNQTAPASTISYATVEYGGLPLFTRGGIHVEGSSPTLDHVTVRNNLVAAITVKGGSPGISNDSFSGNPAGLINQLPASRITARLNYWSTVDGPSGNGTGTGQSVSAGVLFEPWLVAAPSSPQFFNSFSQKNRTFNPAIAINTTIIQGTAQSGTWQLRILDSGGTVLRSYSGSGTSGTVVWDGKNGATPPIDEPDGTYTYQLDSTAGTAVATTARGLTLLDRTKQLTISNLSVAPPFFSPNGDGVQDTTTLTGTNPFDDTTLTVNVKNSVGSVVRTSSSSGADLSYLWDGKNGSAPAVVQPDGVYTFEVVARNGTASATSSATVTLDDTPPAAAITAPADGQVLSNVYVNGVTSITVTGSATDLNFQNWSLDYGSGGSPTTFTALGSGTSPVTNVTLGTWATAPPIANGLYTLRLQAWDQAGNHSVTLIKPTVGNFAVAQQAINQMNAATGGTVTYTSTIPFTLTETLVVKNLGGQIVRTVINAAARNAGSFIDTWDGRNDRAALVPDGPYFYVATATAGASSMTWDITNTLVTGGLGTYQDQIFASSDPFNNLPLTFTYTFPSMGRVWVRMRPGGSGGAFGDCSPPGYCFVSNQYQESGNHTLSWAWIDNTGAFRGDVTNVDIQQSTYLPKNVMVVFGTKPSVTNVQVTRPFYGPANGTQTVSFNLSTYQSQTATIAVAFKNLSTNSVLRRVTLSNQAPGPVTVNWDGHADNGMWVAPGFYAVTVTATDSIGNSASGQILTTIAY
jgi:flagellar hook assembly protein FlgD